jgi:hypothetical protein
MNFSGLGPMKPTFSKFAQPSDHKRKGGGDIPPVPEPKKRNENLVQVERIENVIPAINPIRESSHNDIISNVFEGIESTFPVKTDIDDKYLVFIIGCVVVYLYTTHAPDRFSIIST